MKIQQKPRLFLNRLLGCITAASLITVSLAVPACDADDDTDLADEERSYTGEELFAGFFLNTGPVAGSIQSLQSERGQAMIEEMSDSEWAKVVTIGAEALRTHGLTKIAEELETTPREQLLANSNGDQMDGLSEILLALISAEEPDFFASFAADITSGDHYRVAAAMGKGSELLLDALAGLKLGESTTDQGFCVAVFALYVVFVHVAVNVAVAVNAAVAVNVAHAINYTTGADSERKSVLKGETIIDEITRTFAR